MAGDTQVIRTARHVAVRELTALVVSWKPKVIAVDSPPAFPTSGRSRETEAWLRGLGMNLFATPWNPTKQANHFYDWMREGFGAYRATDACGFSLFDGGESVSERTIEVFPFASAAVLSGGGRPLGVSKSRWRRDVLERVGVDTSNLSGPDQIDAALAALTGLRALSGSFCWQGEPSEGSIVLPCRAEDLLPRYTRRPV